MHCRWDEKSAIFTFATERIEGVRIGKLNGFIVGLVNGLRRVGQQAPEALSGAFAGGDASLHGGGRNDGQQRLLLCQFIDLGVIQHAPPLQLAQKPRRL